MHLLHDQKHRSLASPRRLLVERAKLRFRLMRSSFLSVSATTTSSNWAQRHQASRQISIQVVSLRDAPADLVSGEGHDPKALLSTNSQTAREIGYMVGHANPPPKLFEMSLLISGRLPRAGKDWPTRPSSTHCRTIWPTRPTRPPPQGPIPMGAEASFAFVGNTDPQRCTFIASRTQVISSRRCPSQVLTLQHRHRPSALLTFLVGTCDVHAGHEMFTKTAYGFYRSAITSGRNSAPSLRSEALLLTSEQLESVLQGSANKISNPRL